MSQESTYFGSLESVTNNCEFEVGVARQPSLQSDHNDISYFEVLLPNVLSIEIRESIDMMFRTGTITLRSRTALREILPLTGNEIISVAYKNQFHSALANLKKKIVHFKIFDIKEVETKSEEAGAPGGGFINLYLVEWPIFNFLLDQNFYKTFPISTNVEEGVVASNIIQDMLTSIQGFENYYDIDIEPTPEVFKMHNMWIPRWTVSKSLKYFSQFLINENDKPYYTFGIRSNPNGAGFKPTASYSSIFSMFDSQHFRTYSTLKPDVYLKNRDKSQLTNNDKSGLSIPKPSDDKNYNVLDYIFQRTIKFGDSSKLFQKQLTGRTALLYDYVSGNMHNSITFESFMRNYTTLGQTLPYPENSNFGNQWRVYESVPFNNEHMVNGYLQNKMVQGVFKQMFCSAQCPLNETRAIGEKVELYLPAPDKSKPVDYQMSGRWMTYGVVDVITANGRSFSEVTFARDSFWLTQGDFLNKSLNIYEDGISQTGGN